MREAGAADLGVLERPQRLRAHLAWKVLEDGCTTLLVWENGFIEIEGADFAAVVPLLDGRRDAGAICRDLEGVADRPRVLRCLLELHHLGVLADGLLSEKDQDGRATAFWEDLLSSSRTGNLEGIAVTALGPSAQGMAGRLEGMLTSLGVVTGPSPAALEILVVDDYFDPELMGRSGEIAGPWMPVRPSGRRSWIGPIFLPGRTACFTCLRHRLDLNFNAQRLMADVPVAALPTSIDATLNLSATLAAGWLRAPEEHPLVGNLLSVDCAEGRTERHEVVRRPQCSACGAGGLAEPEPPVLVSRPRTRGGDGGHRVLPAEDTLERYSRLVSPITGVVPHLTTIVDVEGAHVVSAGQAFARPPTRWAQILRRRRNVASGKGTSSSQARAGALAEAVERLSTLADGSEALRVASYAELGEEAVDPRSCLLFSERQYGERPRRIPPGASMKHVVPDPFDEERPVSWVKAWSLTHGRWRWIPAALAYMAFPQPAGHRFCLGDTNGNAAGTCLEEAVLQGALELVERDGVAIWWYNRLRRPAVSLEGVDDAYVDALTRYCRGMNREFWVLDVTVDTGIPTFVAVSRRTDGSRDHPSMGFGAHLDPRAAVMRALTEMVQLLPKNLVQAERSDRRLAATSDRTTSRELQLDEQEHLLPDPNRAPRGIDEFPSLAEDDILCEVERCRGIFEGLGLEMIVHDLTRPDLALPVVKVLVPGLRHYWRRLAPGRLFDVPVSSGWMTEAHGEEELNPIDLT